MKYGDKIIGMEGVITKVYDGAISIDLSGRLGSLNVPLRMVISDYPLKAGQTVRWNMSFIEQEGPEVDNTYLENMRIDEKRRKQIASKYKKEEKI